LRALSLKITSARESRMRLGTAAGTTKHPLGNNMAIAIENDFREFSLVITVGISLMRFL
jgi:hypothetical protein